MQIGVEIEQLLVDLVELGFGRRLIVGMRVEAPRLEPVSVVGAGDAMLAQFLAARLEGAQAEEALRAAVAVGAASVLEVGAGRFDPREAARLAPTLRVEELATVG